MPYLAHVKEGLFLWRYLRGDPWRDPWYAWSLVALATAVSVALNVAHAPDRLAAQLFAALPPIALLGALELLMSVARCGLPHTTRATATATVAADSADHSQDPGRTAATAAIDRTLTTGPRPTLPGRTAAAGNGSGPGSGSAWPSGPGWSGW